MKQNGFRKKLLAYLSEKLSLPSSIVPGTCEIYLCDNRTLYIDAHSGILRADSDCVVFRCAAFTLTIYGSDLLIDASTDHSAYVHGKIAQICFD
ncbi:MAG: YabP/YqfC family sporulation protein [Clostridia bacterium]|nr:YabP/YqfC family sporulation protein [Clostridia bacterium]